MNFETIHSAIIVFKSSLLSFMLELVVLPRQDEDSQRSCCPQTDVSHSRAPLRWITSQSIQIPWDSLQTSCEVEALQ